jgi:hypothetical protein
MMRQEKRAGAVDGAGERGMGSDYGFKRTEIERLL